MLLVPFVLGVLFRNAKLSSATSPNANDGAPLEVKLEATGFAAHRSFCQQTALTGFYHTGVHYKAVFRTDDTTFTGLAYRSTRAFTFKYNHFNGKFYGHRVAIERDTTEKKFFDCKFLYLIKNFNLTKFDLGFLVVAFTGVLIDLLNTSIIVFIEMYRKAQLGTRENTYIENQVAYCPFVWRMSKLYRFDLCFANPNYWWLCDLNSFQHEDDCEDGKTHERKANGLFPLDLVQFNPYEPDPHFALMFFKNISTLVLIRNDEPEKSISYR